MSDEIKYVDADSEEFEDAPRALREAYKKLQAAHKETAKNYATLQGSVTEKAVSDVLAGKGFKNPARVKQALLEDKVDPLDSGAVEAWLTSNGDDYAKEAPGGETTEEQQPASTVSEETQRNYQQLQVTGEAATNDKWRAVQAKITPDMRGDEVLALYKEYGI